MKRHISIVLAAVLFISIFLTACSGSGNERVLEPESTANTPVGTANTPDSTTSTPDSTANTAGISGGTTPAPGDASQTPTTPNEVENPPQFVQLATIRETIPPTYNNVTELSSNMVLVTLDGKIGFINMQGSEIVSPVYDNAYPFPGGTVSVAIGGKWGLIDAKGNEIVAPIYDAVSDFTEGFSRVVLNRKQGFVSIDGIEIVPPIYDYVEDFSNGFARVMLDNKWGFVDRKGNEIVAPIYDEVRNFTDGMAGVRLANLSGFVDENGREVISLQYSSVGVFSEGLAVAYIETPSGLACGFIDRENTIIIPFEYLAAYRFIDGIAPVKISDDQHSFIDKEGNVVLGPFPIFGMSWNGIHDEVLIVRTAASLRNPADVKWALMSLEGEMLTDYRYDGISTFVDGLAKVTRGVDNVTGNMGVINNQGTEIIPCRFFRIDDFHDGVTVVERRIRPGTQSATSDVIVYDTSGNIIVPAERYSRIGEYSDGLARVGNGYIDTSGNLIIPLNKYDNVGREFSDGMLAVSIRDNNSTKWGFVDTTGFESIPPAYDEVSVFSKGCAMVRLDSRWGVIDKQGEVIVPITHEFESIIALTEGLFAVRMGDKWGFVTVLYE